MPTYNIRGIDVDFPFEAYECQLVYMEKVIQSLQEKCNALLESPTGTGKTLCLLCATLAWRKSLGDFTRGRRLKNHTRGSQDTNDDMMPIRGKMNNLRQSQASNEELSQSSSEFPTIIYASRTHSQIRQVIQELKRSSYRPKMMVLGSREQLCIHDQVSLLRGKAQTNACHALCKKRTKRYCGHFSLVSEFATKNPSIGDDPVDIEDLLNIGKSSGACPYYLSREIHRDVDILFAPYNYLIDRGNRRSLKIDWSRSILIFDEAHNLESICADAASFDLPSSLLKACISEAQTCVDLSVDSGEILSDKSSNPENFSLLKGLLLALEKKIAQVPLQTQEMGFTKHGAYIYELLGDLNITQATVEKLIHIIEKACILLEEDATGVQGGGSNKTGGTIFRLESMRDILGLIFKDNSNAHAQYYRVHVQHVEANSADGFQGKPSRTFSWWCFNPGVAMEEFSGLGVGSIILTSGTLSPLDSFAEELKLDFPIRLENPHVISGNQIWAGVAPVGPSGYSFNSSYRCRGTTEYKTELGNAIVNFARIVPDGLLVFFPSYYALEQLITSWKTMGQQSSTNSTTIWERICKHKLPVIEPRQSSLFPVAIEDFMKKLKDPTTSGAIFFAVCRGKVSEGLDFADHAGRAVVITGLPFPSVTDSKVRLKREYLDQQPLSQRIQSKGLSGSEWYSQQESRAVNQAVGRVIRHRHDYGAIIFCDERFTYSNRQSQISRWIQPHIKSYSKFGEIVYTLTRFFRDAATHIPIKLETIQTVDQEDVKVLQSPQLFNKFQLKNGLTTQTTSTLKYETRSFDMTTSREVKQENISHFVKEIVPANRSSLTLDKPFQSSSLKCGSDLIHSGTSRLISENKSIHGSVVETSATCMSNKRKLVITGPNCSETCKPLENNPNSLDGSLRKLVKCGTIGQKQTSVHLEYNDLSRTSIHKGEEKKGSDFLVQVREKLSDAEYKEFVGFMKALKSKSMKIGDVLQSIARLFSLPGRTSLLNGFKGYVPAKYSALYEKYLCNNSNNNTSKHQVLEIE